MNNKDIKLHGKEAPGTGGWLTVAPVSRFQTLHPDWSTSPDFRLQASTVKHCVRITQNLSKYYFSDICLTVVTTFFNKNAPDSSSTFGKLACKNTPKILTAIHSTK
ncbi:hypothetical protein T4C_475 [Trichinella pseudospiralis]|uniref:Uncharacterized protein n=1 Tax=Trichinella pseudospiralis TaxID=6337 RepID=A0A0V1KCX2_TRIPS|nr:hypothetical protein T4C_475 [Trichinella pseudospiralis]